MWSASRSAPSSPLIGALFEATWQSLREVAVTPRLRPLSKPSDLAACRPKWGRSGSDLAGRGFIAPALMPSMKLRLAPRRS